MFEYWTHAASYLPMQDYRFMLPAMHSIRRGESRYFSNADKTIMKKILKRIQSEGPLKARDFSSTTEKNGYWWNWKPTKHALETLFMRGELMVSGRHGMEKIYDLTERVLPSGVRTTEPGILEFAAYLVNLSLKAHGFTTLKQILHLRTGDKLRRATNSVLRAKMESGEILEYKAGHLPTLYVRNDVVDNQYRIAPGNIRILSPFDNFIIHRDRIKQLFNFDYRLECYLPKHKRRFGYFCLSILHKDDFVGSIDCKSHRDTGDFEIIQLHLDNHAKNDEQFTECFIDELIRFSQFNDCKSISLTGVAPRSLKKMIQARLIQKGH